MDREREKKLAAARAKLQKFQRTRESIKSTISSPIPDDHQRDDATSNDPSINISPELPDTSSHYGTTAASTVSILSDLESPSISATTTNGGLMGGREDTKCV